MRVETKAVTKVLLADGWHDVAPYSFTIETAEYTRAFQRRPTDPIDQGTPFDTLLRSNVMPVNQLLWTVAWTDKVDPTVVYVVPIRTVLAVACTVLPPKPAG